MTFCTLDGPPTQSNNNSIKEGPFPKNANVASVTPLDKKTDQKNSTLNFRPKSISTGSSKVYENIQKNI